jgi:type-F conjugative transfer system protein TrbI
MNRFLMVFGVLASLALACALALSMNCTPKIISVDLARIKGQFIAQLAHHAASPQQVAQSSHRFNRTLGRVLDDYAKHTHGVIFEKPVVLRGAHDATDEIMVLLAKAMGGTS